MTRHYVLPERGTRRGGIVFDPPRRRWPAALAGCGLALAIFACWRLGSDRPPESMPAAATVLGQRLSFGQSLPSIDVSAPVKPRQASAAPVAARHDPFSKVATLGVPLESVPPEPTPAAATVLEQRLSFGQSL